MTVFEKTSEIACSAEALFAWHARPGALARLTPPFEAVRNASEVEALIDGAKATLEMAAGPVWTKWTAHTEQVRPGRGFVDVQERGPFTSWRHEHIFEPLGDGRCTLTDRIHYELPVGALGRAFGGGIIERRLERGFAFRHATTKLDFDLYASLGSERPLVVGITGASGLIGRELATLLGVSGHEVRPFVRGTAKGARAIRWDPATGEIDARVEGLDVVVHLAGEPIAEGRLDDAHRKRVRESRVEATRKLVDALGRLERRPRAFISSSAVGYYGDRGDELLDEDAPHGAGFLAELCEEWEAAARTAERHGMRWASLRTGIVLSPAGGALAKMLPPFSAGAGAVLGDGKQWAPYLSIDEVGAVCLRAIVDERVRGPVNAVGPAPMTNREFTSTLADVLHRPAIARVPKFAARALFGALADEALLASQRVVPGRLAAWGHRFRHAATKDALRHVLGRATTPG